MSSSGKSSHLGVVVIVFIYSHDNITENIFEDFVMIVKIAKNKIIQRHFNTKERYFIRIS